MLDTNLGPFVCKLEKCVYMSLKTLLLGVTAHFILEGVINCEPSHRKAFIYRSLILTLEILMLYQERLKNRQSCSLGLHTARWTSYDGLSRVLGISRRVTN
jgi:hypothetical protein